MECIVHFEVIRSGQSKMLRGLIDLTEGSAPTTEQLITMFAGLGHNVKPDPNIVNTFNSTASTPYKIRVKKLDIQGIEENEVPDREREALLRNLMNLNR